MKIILLISILLVSFNSFSQIRIYDGTIDKYPITLTTYSYSDGTTRANYVYKKFDTPITVNGELKNNMLTLYEKSENNEITASLLFNNFNPRNNKLSGRWITKIKQKQLDINLTKVLEFDSYDATSFERKELIQSTSTADHYFKLLVSKKSKEMPEVVGVKIYQKKTDRLIQELKLDCEFRGLDDITVGDYNFDGIQDFSVFETGYAGPNTSRIYILRKPNAETYFVSEIEGISLTFDKASKTISEHNVSEAGKNQMIAKYKVINNKMVLSEKKCLIYDEKKEDYINTKCD